MITPYLNQTTLKTVGLSGEWVSGEWVLETCYLKRCFRAQGAGCRCPWPPALAPVVEVEGVIQALSRLLAARVTRDCPRFKGVSVTACHSCPLRPPRPVKVSARAETTELNMLPWRVLRGWEDEEPCAHGVQGLGFRTLGLGFRVQDLGARRRRQEARQGLTPRASHRVGG